MRTLNRVPTDQPAPLPADAAILARLRAGDETAFAGLIEAWSPGMLRTARCFVADAYAAEDVVQDAWLAILAGHATRCLLSVLRFNQGRWRGIEVDIDGGRA